MAGPKEYRKKITRGDITLVVTQFKKGVYKDRYRIQGRVDGKFQTFGIIKDKAKAEKKARDKAQEFSNANDSIQGLTHEEKELCRYVLESQLTIDDLRRVVESMKRTTEASLQFVIDGFIKQKSDDDLNVRYFRDLKNTTSRLTEAIKSDRKFNLIEAEEVEKWLNSLKHNDKEIGAKRKKAIRAILSSMWEWALVKKYAAVNIINHVHKPRVKARSGGHEVLAPREFAILLYNVEPEFKAWCAIAGFAGLRTSEICGEEGAREDRLKWEDFDWKHKRISIRPETSKTGKQRYVPICDALMDWLREWREGKVTSYVHNTRFPTKITGTNKGNRTVKPSETQRLGELIGGWRDNCLRASRASYRLAETNEIDKTAMEGGHTREVMMKDYLNPRFAEDAEEYFSLTPDKVKRMIEEKVIKLKA